MNGPFKKFDPFIFCWLQLCKFDFKAAVNKIQVLGSGCGSVGKVVTSKTEVRGSNPVIGKNLWLTLLSVMKRRK